MAATTNVDGEALDKEKATRESERVRVAVKLYDQLCPQCAQKVSKALGGGSHV